MEDLRLVCGNAKTLSFSKPSQTFSAKFIEQVMSWSAAVINPFVAMSRPRPASVTAMLSVAQPDFHHFSCGHEPAPMSVIWNQNTGSGIA